MINEVSINIILLITTIVVGALTTYFKTNAKLKEKANQYITEAEEKYADTTKAGGEKLEFAVNKLYSLVPVFLKPIITKDVISTIVQQAFNSIQTYTRTQLDKFIASNIIHEDGR